MKIRYTEHALYRLHLRGITKEEVESALRFGKTDTAHDGRMRAIWQRENKHPIVVVYCIKGLGEILIITAYEQKNEYSL